jgi:hypothetical protein
MVGLVDAVDGGGVNGNGDESLPFELMRSFFFATRDNKMWSCFPRYEYFLFTLFCFSEQLYCLITDEVEGNVWKSFSLPERVINADLMESNRCENVLNPSPVCRQ